MIVVDLADFLKENTKSLTRAKKPWHNLRLRFKKAGFICPNKSTASGSWCG
jgi:hypothetical protein